MPAHHLFLLFLTLLGLELTYFWLAKKYEILDIPNERSSHTNLAIRGGGIIIPIAGFVAIYYQSLSTWNNVVALALITVISLLDDLYTFKAGTRILVQFTAVYLMSMDYPQYWMLGVLIIGAGFLNTYNFMDGVNGITFLYSLVVLMTLYYLLPSWESYFTIIGIALMVFGFFNFRPKGKAVTFMGDAGSVPMGFLILIPLTTLIYANEAPSYVMLVAVYGIDSVGTILIRLIRGENIFEAHRLHLYQLLCNEHGWPHLLVALLYASVQLGISILFVYTQSEPLMWLVILLILVLVYAMVRFVFLQDTLRGKM